MSLSLSEDYFKTHKIPFIYFRIEDVSTSLFTTYGRLVQPDYVYLTLVGAKTTIEKSGCTYSFGSHLTQVSENTTSSFATVTAGGRGTYEVLGPIVPSIKLSCTNLVYCGQVWWYHLLN